MKADFEKGTKVCSKCRKELPISCFNKCKSRSDGLSCRCKECRAIINKRWYNKDIEQSRKRIKNSHDKMRNVFQRMGHVRGNSGMLKDNVYNNSGGCRKYITKWWKGEIRHWTVNDGIWKEG